MARRSKRQRVSDAELQREIDRCHREIAEVEAQIRAGNPDLEGLCPALSDWSWELRILQERQRHRSATDTETAATGSCLETSVARRSNFG